MLMWNVSFSFRERTLKDHGAELLWMKTKDLLDSKDQKVKELLLLFYVSLITGQYESLEVMRAHFFRVMENHKNDEELVEPLVRLLEALTRNERVPSTCIFTFSSCDIQLR